MNSIRHLPLVGCVALIYAAVAMVGGGAQTVLSTGLPSGAQWSLGAGDLLVVIAVVALYFEVLKATRTTQASVVDHILSLFAFVACLFGFLFVGALGTSTFLVIMIMALVDVIAGFTVTISTARRDFSFPERE
ncbi:MAG: hypothetical protein FJX54_13380 [Alphaproteobacteria bacterium]|nr:hypothetical protein [Alphaproteobacteria bacterium]